MTIQRNVKQTLLDGAEPGSTLKPYCWAGPITFFHRSLPSRWRWARCLA